MGLLDNFSFENAKTNLLGTTPEEQSKALSSISAALRRSTKPGESAFGNVSQAILGGKSERDIATKNSSLEVKKAARDRANDFLALMPNGKNLSNLSQADQLKVKTYIESEDGDYSSLFNLSWGEGEKKGKVLPAMLGKFTTESLDVFGKSGVFADLEEVTVADKEIATKREGQYQIPGETSSVFGYTKNGKRYMEDENGKEVRMPKGYRKVSEDTAPDLFKRSGDLRKELAGDFDYKNFKQAQLQLGKIKTSAAMGTAAGDLSLIFAYMKMLDPTSVVRESEQATAENARGVPESVRNLYNKVMTGEKMGAGQGQDFVDTAEALFSNIEARAQPTINRIRGIAERANVPMLDVFGVDPDESRVLYKLKGLTMGTERHKAAFNSLSSAQQDLAIKMSSAGKL